VPAKQRQGVREGRSHEDVGQGQQQPGAKVGRRPQRTEQGGFQPLLNPRPMIILTTAYDQYALKAYDLEVKDYLVKPISFERFYKGVLRLYQSQPAGHSPATGPVRPDLPAEADFIFIKVGTRIQKVAVKDIVLVEGMKDYLRIHTTREKLMTLMSFAKLEELLPPNRFARVHKSYVVAIDKIDHIERNRITIAGQLIPISDTYREGFSKRLKGLL
jgi:DNA-binding LytR/AlgR family response regulator